MYTDGELLSRTLVDVETKRHCDWTSTVRATTTTKKKHLTYLGQHGMDLYGWVCVGFLYRFTRSADNGEHRILEE